MSYQLGAAPPVRSFMPQKPTLPVRPGRGTIRSGPIMPGIPPQRSRRIVRTGARRMPMPSFRHTQPVRVLRVGAQTVTSAGGAVFIPAGSDLSGLGFSLKRPKWMRKMTLKKLVKPLLITGAVIAGAAFIPGALPLLAKGAVGAGKLAVGTGRLAVRGVTGAGKFAVKNVVTAGKVFTKQAVPQAAVTAMTSKQKSGAGAELPSSPTNAQIVIQTPKTPGEAAAQAPGGAGGAGGAVSLTLPSGTNADVESGFMEQPTQAGMGGGMVPLAIGAVALLAIMSTQKRGR